MGLIIEEVTGEAQELFNLLNSIPPKKLILHDDPVALAVASYEHWKTTGHRWAALEDMTATEDQRRTAQALKAYYRERMVFESLKTKNGANVSDFRKKLGQLVTDQLDITSQEVGLLMRLPYFYEEDREVDSIVAQTQPASDEFSMQSVTTTFTLKKRVLRSRRMGDYYDYWMTSDHSPAAYKLVMKHDNNLRGFIESFIQQPFRVQANVYAQHMRGFWRGRLHYQIALTGIA